MSSGPQVSSDVVDDDDDDDVDDDDDDNDVISFNVSVITSD